MTGHRPTPRDKIAKVHQHLVSVSQGSSGAFSTLLTGIRVPGSAVVIGPPGSGKTTLAIKLANAAVGTTQVDYVVASEHLVSWLSPQLAPGVRVMTWRSWLTSTYAEAVGGRVPRKRRGGLGTDWKAAMAGVERAEPVAGRQVVLDEAQDIPSRLVAAIRSHASNLMAFTDPFQRQAEDGSSLEDLVNALRDDHPWPVFVLEEDFRTTYEIQRLAVSAWVPDRADPPRPARNRGPIPRLLRSDFAGVAAETARLLASHTGRVMVASAHADRAEIFRALEERGVPLSRGGLSESDAVNVLAFQTLRGLEFEAVVLVPPRSSPVPWSATASDLYVAATRARHELSIVFVGEPDSELATSIAAPTAMGFCVEAAGARP